MARKRRVTPSVEEIGVPKGPQPRRIPRYNIVGDAGTPVGPNPLEQLSAALGGFNQGFNVAAAGKAEADRQRAADMMPELAKHVSDTAIKLKKGYDELNINQVYNPAVISAGYKYSGDRFGQEDVFKIARSTEFYQYAQSELNNEGDYKQKLTDRILSLLPNRDIDDKTQSQYWKRGYDPAVQDASDKVLPVFLKNWEDNQLSKSREDHILKAQASLTSYLDGETELSDFTDLMADQRNTLIVPAGKFSATIIKDAVTPVLQGKISDPDTDLDALQDKVEAIWKARRKTDKGSTVLFGSKQKGLENMFANMYDAEMSQGSKSRQKTQAIEAEFRAIADDLGKGWPMVQEKFGPQLANLKAVEFTDLTAESLPKLAKMLLTPDENGQSFINAWDEKKWDSMSMIQQGAFVEEMKGLYVTFTNKKSAGLDTAEQAVLAGQKRVIAKFPQYTQAITNQLPKLMEHFLMDGPFKTHYNAAIYENIQIEAMAQELGMKEGVLVKIIDEKISASIDSAGPQAAQMILQSAQQLKENSGVIPEGYVSQLRNVIEKTYSGEEETDRMLSKLADELEGETKIGPYVKELKFKDILEAAAQKSENPAFREAVKWYEVNVWRVNAAGEKNEFDPEAYTPSSRAAGLVGAMVKEDFDRLAAQYTRTANNKATDMREHWDSGGKADVEREITDHLLARGKSYGDAFEGHVTDVDASDKANASAITGADGTAIEQANYVDGIYGTNMDEIGDLFNETLNKDETGMTKLAQLKEGDGTVGDEKGEKSLPYKFYAEKLGFSGDTRYSKLHSIKAESSKLMSDLESKITSLRGEAVTLSEQARDKSFSHASLNKASREKNKQNQGIVLRQYKAAKLRYQGVSWKNLLEGKANFNFDSDGVEIEVPVELGDVNWKSSILFKDWDELNHLEDLFDREETLQLGTWQVDENSTEPPALTDEEQKSLDLYAHFVRETTGLDLREAIPSMRTANHRKYKEWSAAQRMQMMATDPSKMPSDLTALIKKRALDNFTDSGHTTTEYLGGKAKHQYRWKGEFYTANDASAVRAVRKYNDFVASKDFSMKTGLSGEEYMTMYGLLARGQVYPKLHYRKITPPSRINPKLLTWPSTSTQHAGEPLFLKPDPWMKYQTRGKGNMFRNKPMKQFDLPKSAIYTIGKSADKLDVMAEELFLSELGAKDVTAGGLTSAGVQLSGGKLTEAQYRLGTARWKKLLNSPTRSKLLSEAFQRMHNNTDFDKLYGEKDDNSIRSLLAPFELEITPIPDR